MIYDTSYTKEDYLHDEGVDLNEEIMNCFSYDVDDNPAPCFIYGIEEFLKDSFSTGAYTWNRELSNDRMKEFFKRAVRYQIKWVIRNSDISNDSGYNQQTGMIVPRETLEKISIPKVVRDIMHDGGMANLRRW